MKVRGAFVGILFGVAGVGCGSSVDRVAEPRAAATGDGASGGEPLAFRIDDGNIRNHLVRDGDVAAHLLTTSGDGARIIVAFPAGNTGIGIWFDGAPAGTELAPKQPPEPTRREDGMRGIRAVLTASEPELRVGKVLMSNVRVLRTYVAEGNAPRELEPDIDAGPPVVLRRTTLDGEHHVELRLEPLGGTTIAVDDRGGMTWSAAGDGGEIAVRVTALHDDPPLTPIPRGALVTDAAQDRPGDLDALAFLSYEEKLLAGSWRFNTYFGRDTLLSVMLLMPVLTPSVIEAGLGSVLERLGDGGEVAHEEDIGEFASLRRTRDGEPASRDPLYSFAMVDDNLILAPVLARYLLDSERGRERAAAFLARETSGGERYADALRENLEFVLEATAPFAEDPVATNLIALRPGHEAGDWRDSDAGLGGGRYSFNVNGVLAPAALRAAARLYASGLLGDGEDRASRARELAAAWERAAALFEVEIPARRARARIDAYADARGFDPAPARAAIAGPVTFPAVAIDEGGDPIPVMHSDDSFTLLFLSPGAERLQAIAERILRPFPAGLRTPVGVVAANAVLAGDGELRGMFTRDHYHGASIWSWQQAALASGLARQLERDDLPDAAREPLVDAQAALWDTIRRAEEVNSAELWTWSIEDGAFVTAPFGHGRDDESNAVQLWSTVYLGIAPPASAE